MDEEPDFSLGLSFLNSEEPDFSLGLSLDSEEADFSLGLDISYSDSDDDDQDGGRHTYTIQLVKERLIKKFDVHGYDYQVHVDAFDRNIDFTVAVQMLHGILTGWYFWLIFFWVRNF